MIIHLEEKDLRIQKRHLREILYISILLILFVAFEYIIKHKIVTNGNLQKKVEVLFIFSLFGLFHILANNIIAFLYNISTFILPLSKRPLIEINPKNIKIIGVFLLIISLIGWLIIFVY